MIKPQTLANDELRWDPAIEWSGQELMPETIAVTFLRLGKPLLKVEVGKDLHAFLTAFQPQARSLASLGPKIGAFVDFLKEHGILTAPFAAAARATVSIYAASGDLITAWELPAERALAIDLLAGDEASLAAHFRDFSERRPPGHLASFIKIYTDLIELGPVRFPYEGEAPVQRAMQALHFPAWPARLEQAFGQIQELLAQALTSPQWYALTTNGLRRTGAWEEMGSPYRIQAAPTSQRSESVPFFHWQAQVEGEEGAGGSGSTAATAEYAARCEAWERYVLARGDLALSADELEGEELRSMPGLHFDYLRTLAKPIRQAPKTCLGWTMAHHAPVKVPTEWMYFDGPSSAANSNGAAFGSNLRDAELAGKFEVVERHLLLKSYLQLSQGTEFVPALGDLDPAIAAFVQSPSRRARWYDLGSCNGTQVVVCVIGSDSPPFASIGSAGKSTRAAAAKKALYEALLVDSLWSRRIEQHGPQGFLRKGKEMLQLTPQHLGLEESAWHWAALEGSEEMLHRRFHTGTPPVEVLDEACFVAVDLGRRIVPQGAVVKVIHPDALPLPSCFSQALHLFRRLKLFETLPIPMY